jgi:membrane-bound lytic murein transglycosylase B
MQLLPSTWAVVGRDGNGDGVADPNNVYDAAASAARYLCLASAPLGVGSEAGLHQAIFSYNHSDDYVTAVMALAQLYASLAGH